MAKTVKEILKNYKDDIQVEENDLSGIDVIPSGSLQLDVMLNVGGFPRGRVTTIAGKEASGKTTLCYKTVINAQKQGLKAAIINAEGIFDPTRAKDMGMDLDDLLVITPRDFETAADFVCDLAASGEIDLIIFDSLVGLPIKALNEGVVEDHNVGRKAKLLGNFLTKVVGPVKANNVALILINQFRASMAMYGANYLMPGGYALTYASSIILYLFGHEEKEKPYISVDAKLKKNNLGVPFREVKYNLYFENGYIDPVEEIGQILTNPIYTDKLGVERSGAWYTVPFLSEEKLMGSKAVINLLKENPDKLKEAENFIIQTLTRKKVEEKVFRKSKKEKLKEEDVE